MNISARRMDSGYVKVESTTVLINIQIYTSVMVYAFGVHTGTALFGFFSPVGLGHTTLAPNFNKHSQQLPLFSNSLCECSKLTRVGINKSMFKPTVDAIQAR